MPWFESLVGLLLPRRLVLRAYRNHYKHVRRSSKLKQQALLNDIERTVEARVEKQTAAGYEKGVKAGYAVGRDNGRLAAYNKVASEIGLLEVTGVEEIPVWSGMQVDLDKLRPNIYKVDDGRIVRVIYQGQRIVKKFTTTGSASSSQLATLIQAIKFRDSMTQAVSVPAIYQECRAQAAQRLLDHSVQIDSPIFMTEYHAAQLYHAAMLRAGPHHDDSALHLGEDPEDRLNITDKSILSVPWAEWIESLNGREVPQRIRTIFAELGICQHRTVRDLLMISVSELEEIKGAGPATIRGLREGLSAHGLAFWGDPVPTNPQQSVNTPNRNHRRIEFD